MTSTWIGGALGDKMTRYALLTRSAEPMLWTLVLPPVTISYMHPG